VKPERALVGLEKTPMETGFSEWLGTESQYTGDLRSGMNCFMLFRTLQQAYSASQGGFADCLEP
jgi:hypothetical protein